MDSRPQQKNHEARNELAPNAIREGTTFDNLSRSRLGLAGRETQLVFAGLLPSLTLEGGQKNNFLTGSLPDGQMQALSERLQRPLQDLKDIRKEVNEVGQPAKEFVQKDLADPKLRVYAWGESHGDTPHRKLGRELIPSFVKAGYTHLAVEATQKQIDKYFETGDRNQLPALLRGDTFVGMLNDAKKANMRIVGVDKPQDNNEGRERDGITRDEFMANGIESILDKDKSAKVLFWVGDRHLENTGTPEDSSAAAQLKRKYGKEAVRTVSEQTGNVDVDSLQSLTQDLKEPVAISTKKAPLIRDLDTFAPDRIPKHKYGYWDIIIGYGDGH